MIDQTKMDASKLGFFRFKKMKDHFLLTNDVGEYSFLSTRDFDSFLTGRLGHSAPNKYNELQEKGFLKDRIDLQKLITKYASRHAFLASSTSLHIVVVTLRCNHSCLYCQTSSRNTGAKHLDMDIATARKVVDRIFESPNPSVTIEFQGGEPLLNFDIIRFIIEETTIKNKTTGKNLLFALVSNLTSITSDQYNYLVKHKVSICTSLDGPARLHNKHRVFLSGADSHQKTIIWLKKFKKSFNNKTFPHHVNALATITRYSFPLYRQIIDEYIRLGLDQIHLRPVTQFGLAKCNWSKIGFSAADFLAFYKKTLDYIINKNVSGKQISERTAVIFLKKILSDNDPNFLDMRSPCGAATGQLAYDYNGDVYSCDEGRMLGQMGEKLFKLGRVDTHSHADLIKNPVANTLAVSSCLENLAGCSDCVYNPYCGVCPIYNYNVNNNIFGKEPFNDRCRINKGILDYIFEKMKDKKTKKIFNNWCKKRI
jgi:His-Xaa-Ser system radical SAM maturase HxsB